MLISYVTAGSGHRRAAEAVAEAVRRQHPEAAVRCEDFLAFTAPWWRASYARIYRRFVMHAPWLWGWLYHLLDQSWMFACYQPWRRRWNRRMGRAFLRHLVTEQPEVVLVTHFLPADVVTGAKRAGLIHSRVIVVVTDFHPHRMWMVHEADDVVVAVPESADACRRLGAKPERVHAHGIPIRHGFCVPADRARWLQTLRLDPDRRTLLLTSGGMGVGPLERLVRGLMALESVTPGRLQLLVVCGDNHALMDRLHQVSRQTAMPIRVFGFVETMSEFMQISDLLITKPGGLTVVEALAVGVPMVFCDGIPGQEQANAAYVVREGAGIETQRPSEAIAMVRALLNDATRLNQMRLRAKALGRPQAASRIVEELVCHEPR